MSANLEDLTALTQLKSALRAMGKRCGVVSHYVARKNDMRAAIVKASDEFKGILEMAQETIATLQPAPEDVRTDAHIRAARALRAQL